MVPVGEVALGALERYLREGRTRLVTGGTQEDHVFVSRTGRPLSSSDVQRRLARYLARAGAPTGHFSPHSCGTRSPPICSRGARTCGSSRSCSGILRCAPLRSTRTCRPLICARRIAVPILGRRERNDDRRRHRSSTISREAWRLYKEQKRPPGARPADPGVLASGQVRGRPHEQRAACSHRGGGPGLVRSAWTDRRAGALRPVAEHQVRDLRRLADQRAPSSTSCARSTGCRGRCGVGRARWRRR